MKQSQQLSVNETQQQTQICVSQVEEETRVREEVEKRTLELSDRLKHAEMRAENAEAWLLELQSHWTIPRSEIKLTGSELGTGAYGRVVKAQFRGCSVAAKFYHRILISDHTIRHFRREITMAAHLRHPNLVQFIGASMEGELILLTELMSTSLGDLMHQEPLSDVTITSISLDVAKALNYLHLMQPHPIIHRDISSANVLLDPLPDNCWKVKVSDYGSVNLLQHLNTVHPGNPFYAAPESNNPNLQTPKMDIYSFGVLLAEMLTNELPEKKDRQQQILKISVEHTHFTKLVRKCLSEERGSRPSAQELITQLSYQCMK